MRYLLITYWWIAVSLDWSSTIVAHDWRVEENPFMRDIWKTHGDIGFTIASLLFGFLGTLLFYYGLKYKYYIPILVAGIPMITFKVLIALTNLIVIPVQIMDWFHF